MKNLNTSKQAPSQKLTEIIDAYWMVENNSYKDIYVPIVPDGCVDIVQKNSDIFLVGVMEFASIKCIKPNDNYLGIRFKPAVMASFLDRDISKFNDQLIPLEILDTSLHDRISKLDKSADIYNQLDIIFEDIFSTVTFDKRILNATKEIVLSGGEVDFDLLCSKTALSQKQLERLFIRHVGVTPKKFSRFIRFIQTHKHLSKEGLDDLCLKVLEKGYYDQAHFNREYKALTGLTPSSDEMSIFYNTK